MKIFIVVLFLVCAGVPFAQTGYVHTTNTVTCEMVDNGTIGDNTSGTYSGLTYLGGSNVIHSGGIVVTVIFPSGPPEVSGMCGSYNLNDFVNVVPFSGFTSNPYFDQIGTYTHGSQYAPGNSIVNTFSRSDQPIIYLRQTTPNNLLPFPTYVFHVGLIIDFDIGDYSSNSGGYDPARNLIYTFDASASPSDTNYYGVLLLNVPENSLHGKLIQNYNATNEEIANYCINTDFSTPPDTADQRLHISMPGIVLQPGEVGQWDFAIVCGTSLTDLQNTADTAIAYGGLITGVKDNSKELPVKYSLQQNYPNPFNPTTTIQYQIPELSFVTIKLYDVLGSEVATLVNEEKPIGNYEVNWNAEGLTSGVYFYQLKAGDFLETKKMVLLK